jgi:type IV pilus assembly protein PilM
MISFLKKKGKTTVGLDIGSSLIKAVEIDHTKEEPTIVRFGMTKLLPEAIVDGEIMDRNLVIEGIQQCLASGGISRKDVVTAVSGRAVIVKKVVMDKMSPDDAQEAIFWEAEQHVPFDIDDVCLDFQVLKEDVGANQMEILLVAAKKDMINTHAELVRDAGLNPMVIDVDSFAIQNAFEMTEPREEGSVKGLINIGADVTNINIVQDDIPHFTRDLSIGANSFIEAFQKELGVGYEEASGIITGEFLYENQERLEQTVRQASSDLSMGIERSISFLKTAGDAEGIDEIVLSGGGARIPRLKEILAAKHGVDFRVAHPLASLSYEEDVFGGAELTTDDLSPLLTVGVGLALRREGDK